MGIVLLLSAIWVMLGPALGLGLGWVLAPVLGVAAGLLFWERRDRS